MGKTTKPKSRKSIASWLKNPHSDAAIYKAMGNSITVACAEFVLAGIVKLVESEGDLT
jgi:DNA (cytosine-5)-methyltransferase 1